VPYTTAPVPFSATTGTMPLEARSVEPKVAPEPARTADSVFMEDMEHFDLSLDAEAVEAPAAKAPVEAPPPSPRARPMARGSGKNTGSADGIAAKPAGRAAEELDDEDEARAGPPTLASMLPEPAGEWPPRRKAKAKSKPDSTDDKTADKVADKADASAEAAEAAPTDEKDPRFLREARRDERWNRPWVRASLGVALVVLAIAAGAQLAYPMRDTIASRWPATAPVWSLVCEQMGCTIEAPRSLTSLALDGSSLTRTDTEHVLLFSADLHNRSDHAVRMPSFDLSFMDLNGQIVARKVLDPAQIGIRQTSIGPEAELHVHARLQVDGLDATGFQAEMFYP
jgi:hypothetical protein